MNCEDCCAKVCANTLIATAHTIFPYYKAGVHIGDSYNRWSHSEFMSGAVKGVCVIAGAVIGAGLTIGLSPKMYEAFYNANNTLNDDTAVLKKQTHLGVEVGAGTCVAFVDFWGLSFGAMVGGEVGDGILHGANWASSCASKMKACTSQCFSKIWQICRPNKQPVAEAPPKENALPDEAKV